MQKVASFEPSIDQVDLQAARAGGRVEEARGREIERSLRGLRVDDAERALGRGGHVCTVGSGEGDGDRVDAGHEASGNDTPNAAQVCVSAPAFTFEPFASMTSMRAPVAPLVEQAAGSTEPATVQWTSSFPVEVTVFPVVIGAAGRRGEGERQG